MRVSRVRIHRDQSEMLSNKWSQRMRGEYDEMREQSQSERKKGWKEKKTRARMTDEYKYARDGERKKNLSCNQKMDI